MKTLNKIAIGMLVAATSAFSGNASSADFPSRTIRIIVPVSAGGWGDVTTRVFAQKLGEVLGQSVLVDNRTGAGGLVGIRYTKEQPADGYTLMSTGSTISIQEALNKEPGFDALKDFTLVGSFARSPALVVAGAKSNYKSFSDLVADAKAHPGQISYGSAGIGTTTHIAAAMMLKQANLQMQHVPYKGNGAAMPDVIAGRVSFMIDAYGSSAAGLHGGLLKALAVTSDSRLPVLADVPTTAQQGLPGFTYYYWLGLFAPAGTPPDVIKKLNDAMAKVLSDPTLKAKLEAQGTEPFYKTTADSASFLKKDLTDNQNMIKTMGIPKQ
ncbi:tripartite tricarboxylate transporter substrate binding protein [Paraburkholderia sp. BL17N1]|uniref:Bug family tripartite tricarboxylate transporter substrate binding protein n=1 Tax=Paraburkholderia sp. BL17N1 TaxID=1938798 RepID=UPI000F26585B|nr:tripartite tricarboxylate transporter substrate binding protein [Paraburkholderia sp. BL17N1]RKR45225.1 tripartite-type tricarboxylate transporter receptor subunit TctC [Paraburkholderia sp. BL17N1]